MPLLQGLRLFIDLDGAGQGKGSLLHHLTGIIEAEGGLVVDHIADATHAVLRHQQQQAYQTALNIGTVSVVPPEWIILSATQQQLQPERAGILQGPGIPGMAEHVREVTLSGITGLDRVMTRYKVECTGCIYTAAMRLNTTTHVISTAEACHTPSEKINAAMQHGIAVVSGEWLDHCLEAWQYVPEEPYRLIPQPHPPPGAQAAEPGEPAAHFNPAAVEQAGASNPAVLLQQQHQQAVGQQQQQALAGFVSQQQGTTQQQPSQRSDGFIPATLENLSSLQPPRPAPYSPAAPSGAVAPTSLPGARAAAGVPVSKDAEAKQALAASADEAGVDAAVAQYDYDGSAAAAAAATGEDVGGVDGGEMSQDVTEEPTQEPEYFEEAAGIEGEVDSHMHSLSAAAGATAAAPDAGAEAAAAVVDDHAAPGVAADAVRPRPASTEPLDPTEVLEGDAAAVEDDGEPDVTSQVTPLKQHAAPAPQQLQQDAAQLDDGEVVQGQHQEEPQQQGELQQQEEEQQHEGQEQLGEERHWEGEDDSKGDLVALQQPHKPQLELGAAAGVAAAPAGPDEAGETEQPAAASTPRLLAVDVLGAEADPTASPGAAAKSHETPEQELEVDAAGAQHVQLGITQHATPQQQQQQQEEEEEMEEEVHAGADAAAMAADDPGVGVSSLVFNMGTLANTSQGVLRADRFVDELIGDLAFPTDSESPVPKPTAHAARPSRLQQQQQPTEAEAPGGGGSMHDLAAAPAAPSGGGSAGAASGRSSRSLGASGFKVAGLSRRRASAATPAAAPGVAAAEAAAPGPVADLAAGDVGPAEGDDAPAAFPTNVPDPAADQTAAAADSAGGRGRRTRARAASASPRLARGRTAAGPAAATPDAAVGDAATASCRRGSAPQQQTALAAQLLNGAAHSDKRSAATPQQQALDHAAQGAAGADTEQAEEQQQQEQEQEQPKARSRRSAGVRAGTASKATPKLVAARRQRLQQHQTEQEPVAEQEQPHKTGRQRQQKQQQKQREAAGDSHDVAAAGPADDAGGADEVDTLLDEYLQVQDDAALPDEPPPAAAADVQPAKRRGSAAAKRPAATTTAAAKRKRAASNAIEQVGADGEQPPEAGVAGAAVAARSSRKRRKSAAPAAAATPSVSQDIDDAAGNAAVPEASEEHHSPDVDVGGAARTKGRGQAARRAASAAGAAVGGRAAYKRQQQQQPEEGDSHDDQEATLAGQQQEGQEEQVDMKSNRSRKQGRAAAKATSKQQQQQQQDTRAGPSELDVQPKRGRKRGMQQHADTAEDAAGGAAGDAHTRQVSADDGAVLQPGSKRRTRAEQQQQQQPQEVEDMCEQEQEEEIPRPKRQRKQGLRQAQQAAGHLVSSEPGTSDDDEAGTEPNQPQPAKRATAAKRLGQRSKAAATKQPKTAPRAKQSGAAAAAAVAEPASPAAEPPASADASPAVAGVTPPVVALSGMHSDERQRHAATLRRLRVRCLPTSHDWQVGTTHIVQPELKRGEKSLAGMAAGAWLVKQEWLVQSGAAGRLLDPEPYELEACETATGSIAEGAPMHWRVRRQALAAAADQPDAAFDAAGSYGAFAGLRVIFYGSSDAPSFASLARMLKAGGGQVLRKVPPYTSLLPAAAGESKAGRAKAARKVRSSSGAAGTGSQGSGAANLAVIGPDKSSDDSVVSSLREAGVPCVSPAYLVDWLAQPWLSLEQHYLFGDQAAQSGELQQLEAARGAEGQGQQQSASF